ncbi:MAG: hypothetical protein OEX08_01700 [Candidatus Nomurabacteria bacterium]|nr:hypothetical protein [Candidatus Nomurabacteria bacterium]
MSVNKENRSLMLAITPKELENKGLEDDDINYLFDVHLDCYINRINWISEKIGDKQLKSLKLLIGNLINDQLFFPYCPVRASFANQFRKNKAFEREFILDQFFSFLEKWAYFVDKRIQQICFILQNAIIALKKDIYYQFLLEKLDDLFYKATEENCGIERSKLEFAFWTQIEPRQN